MQALKSVSISDPLRFNPRTHRLVNMLQSHIVQDLGLITCFRIPTICLPWLELGHVIGHLSNADEFTCRELSA